MKISVVGGGLGGLSAAIALATRGDTVTLFEKNAHFGGKLNRRTIEGFTFDLGPSILTLPDHFRRLFTEADRRLEDYCTILPLETHWRNFFEDGIQFDFFSDEERTADHLESIFPGSGAAFRSYSLYMHEQDRICRAGYFDKGIDTALGMFRGTPLLDLLTRLDITRSMHGRNTRFFGDTPLRDAFDYFIKYVGSSPLDSPGFMNLLPAVQWADGLWYVEGGLFALSTALQQLARELGVTLHTEAEVTQIHCEGGAVKGIEVKGVGRVNSDLVVSNMEVIPCLDRLTPVPKREVRKLENRFPPACSGLVLHLGTNRTFDALAHHNFFYAADQAHHFDRVFREGLLPDDPTLYVVAVTRSDPGQAPEGCDNIKILPHIPPIDPDRPVSPADYEALAELCIDKMERMGCKGLRQSIVVRDQWTPVDVEANYYSNRGAIYGVRCDHFKNFALKAPKRCRQLKNLWFVGGSVNPGGGMPMAVLSGYNAAKLIHGEMKAL
ncbi:MAG: phytoene desaturase family protein [Planctomycetota bacterium]|jgi:diapolycopene oxygenase